MAAPKFRVYRKTKKGKKGTDGVCAQIWENEGANGTFLSIQFVTEPDARYKQVAFGKVDQDTYFYNVYENTPKPEEAEPEDDGGPDPDEEGDDF